MSSTKPAKKAGKPLKSLKSKRGGARPGAGKPKGYVHKATLDKAAAREAHREIVMRHMEELTRAQIQNAKGLSHLFVRDDAGRFVQITDPKMIEVTLNAGEQDRYFYIHTKDPSIQAYTDLMNRALDKPKEQEQELRIVGSEAVVARLLAARKRIPKA